MIELFRNAHYHEKAQGFVEYALLIAVIALIVVIAVLLIAPEIGGAFSEVGTTIN